MSLFRRRSREERAIQQDELREADRQLRIRNEQAAARAREAARRSDEVIDQALDQVGQTRHSRNGWGR